MFSCQKADVPENLSEYFLPDLEDGPVIMIYQDSLLENQFEFWSYFLDGTGNIQACQFFGDPFWTQQLVYERSENGFHMNHLEIIYMDNSKMEYRTAEILQDDVFTMKPLAEGYAIVNHFKIYENKDSTRFSEVTKNRFYMGPGKPLLFDGQYHETIRIETRELFENFENGYVESKNQSVEIFAKTLGLVVFDKKNDSGPLSALRLIGILPLESFEAQFPVEVPCLK